MEADGEVLIVGGRPVHDYSDAESNISSERGKETHESAIDGARRPCNHRQSGGSPRYWRADQFWFAAVVGTAAALIVLALFRYIEARLPSEFYAHHMLRFSRYHVMGEEEVRRLINDHGFTIANLSSRLSEGGQQFEYRMTIKSINRKNAETLSSYLVGGPK